MEFRVCLHAWTLDFFFGLVLAEFILKHSDNLSKTIQSIQVSVAEGQK